MWEGVMMFSPYGYAIACQRGEDVVVYKESFETPHPNQQMGVIARFPFLRGIFAFILSLGISLRAYIIANKLSSGEEDVSETFFDRDLVIKIILNSLLGFIVFLLIPDILSRLFFKSMLIISLGETFLRIALLIVYVLVLSLFPSGRRLLQYHGAEHKTINAFEEGVEMVPEEVEIYPRFHPRCGTTLFALVLLLLFFVYLPLQNFPLLTRILLKTLLLPICFPIAFEIVLLALKDKRFSLFLVPGIWLQIITTKSPSRDQLKVAITALKEVMFVA